MGKLNGKFKYSKAVGALVAGVAAAAVAYFGAHSNIAAIIAALGPALLTVAAPTNKT